MPERVDVALTNAHRLANKHRTYPIRNLFFNDNVLYVDLTCISQILDFSRRSDFSAPSKFVTIASPLHQAFLRCLHPRGAIVLDPVPACDKLGSSRIDDRHELLPGDRRSPSTTVVTIGGERHLLGPAPVLSRLSCFIAMSSYGGDALIAFLCTQLDQHGHRVRGAKRPVCAVFDISGYMRCCAYLSRTHVDHIHIPH